MNEPKTRSAMLDTLKQIQKLKKYQVQAEKIADKAEKAGFTEKAGFNLERFRQEFGLTRPIDVRKKTKKGDK